MLEVYTVGTDGRRREGRPLWRRAPSPRRRLLRSVTPPVAAAPLGPGLRQHRSADPRKHGLPIRERGQSGVSARENSRVERLDVRVRHEEGFLGEEGSAEEVEEEPEEGGAGGALPASCGSGRAGGRVGQAEAVRRQWCGVMSFLFFCGSPVLAVRGERVVGDGGKRAGRAADESSLRWRRRSGSGV